VEAKPNFKRPMVQAISDFFRKAEQQVTPDSCGASLYHGVMRHFLLELREVRPQMMFWMSVERRGKYRQPRKRVPRWGAAPSNPNHLELILAISTAVQRQRSSAADVGQLYLQQENPLGGIPRKGTPLPEEM
jgi:hypothetical protein